MAAAFPSGTVTFLFTDIEGSTQLLHRLGELYATLLTDHQRLLRQAWDEHHGHEVDTQGDAFFVAFARATDALAAAAQVQRALAEHAWPDGTALRVRMGLHTGTPQLVADRYVGIDVHRAARIAAAGHGGQILLSPPTRELVANTLPEGVTLRDLGAYQLKDFPQPERLYQVVLPGLPDTFPRLKTLDRPPYHLPARASGFVGREADIDTLTTALRSRQAVAVVGMGGLGKSSLAAEVVHTVARDPAFFPGGMAWVRCDERTGVVGLSWILDQLLTAWEAPLSAEATARAASPEEALELRERALEKRLHPAGSAQTASALVLLDNVEHDLPLARLLDTLASLGITNLLTSRSEPASPRVRLLRLDVLGPEPSVQLFAERFIARGGSWSDERDTAASRVIVDALGGLPLAIELVAARTARTGLPLAALADELHTPDVLARLGDPLDPSASVRYSLAKTLAALTSEQRARFATLGLPEGPEWPAAVVEQMFADVSASREPAPPARADLEALAAYSLLSFVTGRQGQQRIRLHPLLRELAREELARQDEHARRAALAGLLSAVSAWVAQPHRDNEEIMGLLLADEDLIVGTLRAAYAERVNLPLALTLTAALEKAQLYIYRPLRSKELADKQLQAARTLGDRRQELSALDSLARGAETTGHADMAARYRQEALPIARALGERATVVEFTAALGATAAQAGAFDEAQRLYVEARETMREMTETGEHPMDGRMLNILGILATKLRHLGEATTLLERASVRAHDTGDMEIESHALYNLAEVFAMRGDYGEARRLFDQSLARRNDAVAALGVELDAEAAGTEAAWYDKFGELALKTGNCEAAVEYFHKALHLVETSQYDPSLVPHLQGNLAVVRGEGARLRGETAEALRCYEEALALYDQEVPPVYNHMTRDHVAFVHERMALVSSD
jgi:class 3 adenylate cyclase/tetratricopeptide (TPR) repeat protein